MIKIDRIEMKFVNLILPYILFAIPIKPIFMTD